MFKKENRENGILMDLVQFHLHRRKSNMKWAYRSFDKYTLFLK